MAYKITDACVACGTCIGECPVEAISAGDIYVIDADKCIDCGTCAGVCPSEAIIPAFSYPHLNGYGRTYAYTATGAAGFAAEDHSALPLNTRDSSSGTSTPVN